MQLISIGKAASLLGVHPDTLRNWEKSGKVQVYRTPGNHRRYSLDELKDLLSGLSNKEAKDEKKVPNM